MFHKELFDHIWWYKNSEKLKFWSIFVHFPSICGFIDPLFNSKYGLFYSNCLNYLHHTIMSACINVWQWTLITSDWQKIQRNHSLINFCLFLPYLRPCRPLIQCQIWVILCYLFRLYDIIMNSIINHSQRTI